MPVRLVVTAEVEERANAALSALAEQEPPQRKAKTPTAYVREHATEIKALLKKGFTAADIVESLAASGVSITSSTLKRALSGAAPARKRRKDKPTVKEDVEPPIRETKPQRRTDTSRFVDDEIPSDL